MNYYSYHTHTSYCDGKAKAEAFIQRGIDLQMKAIGFSSHAPFPLDVSWNMVENQLMNYVDEIKFLSTKYQNEIDVYLSLEIDYIPEFTKSFAHMKEVCALDYTIGSVHLIKSPIKNEFVFLDGPDTNYSHGLECLYQGDIKQMVTAYYHQVNEMILQEKPDIIGHIDKVKMNNKGRYFSEDEKWYQNLLLETIDIIKGTECIVEINTRGLYTKKSKSFFPELNFAKECKKNKIPMTISTDAHHPDELLSYFNEAVEMLKESGYDSVRIYDKGVWKNAAI
ncbi:histidinol-phosphatase [Ancylomarina sp. 16SWW S1-10-2]|uniref:histidinol-phosphatase n=1 Tax=Ancylomarina sp. 16SWW S1-10-2 TaxID=2499681 RepID=UPI0012AE439C|nr:histidinol-phosphatase [Ancylomarina sp. 16SWW S1-10-2]MRT94124.1 histidinol-phosphatase HisJ family protein [Ancylomarina sp. 16SWW S1-10-2]